MNAELNVHVKALEKKRGSVSSGKARIFLLASYCNFPESRKKILKKFFYVIRRL